MASESASGVGLRRRVYDMVEAAPAGDNAQHMVWFNRGLAILILLNVVAVVLETVESLERSYSRLFFWIELFSVVVFSTEYVLRLWSCTADPNYAHPLWGRLRFALRPMALVDLLAILPTLLAGLNLDLRFIRALRLMRLLRVLKIGRYSESVGLLGNVLRSRASELSVMFFVLMIVIVVASGAVYFAEHDAQPENFSSIPAAMWWAVVTLTTIGYGDIYPKTPLGKVLGGIIAICGIGIVALPTAIIASGFSEELSKRRRSKHPHGSAMHDAVGHEASHFAYCPHCGKPLAPAADTPNAD